MASIQKEPRTFFLTDPVKAVKAKAFAVRRGERTFRLDPKFFALQKEIRSIYPLQELGRLVSDEPDYGISSRGVRRLSNRDPRYIRITDFGEDGIEPDHEFVTAEPINFKAKLNSEDLLFARSGSVGKTYLHEDVSEPALFAGYCIRFRFDKLMVLPKFVYWWTKTETFLQWVETIERPSAQSNVNRDEFKGCPIPLPPLHVQWQLVDDMNVARMERRTKLSKAEQILGNLDDFITDTLGVIPSPKDTRRTFAIRRADLQMRLDSHFHAPKFRWANETLSQTQCKSLGHIATFLEESWNPQDHEEPTFRYIEISTVDPRFGEATWSEIFTNDAPDRARQKIGTNDIIVSLTRPNRGSIALLSQKFEGCIASTGFAVIREIIPNVQREYLWCILRSRLCLTQMFQRASGGSYPAITKGELANIIVPVPDVGTQNRIAMEVSLRREEARRLIREAEEEWVKAKRRFEMQLLRS